MCGFFQSIAPNVLDIATILMPLHHNTLAWRIALSMCKAPASGQWLALEPTLGSLPLPVDDPCAWASFSHLHERADCDESGMELLRALETKNPGIADAYRNVWPVVCTCTTEKSVLRRQRYFAKIRIYSCPPLSFQVYRSIESVKVSAGALSGLKALGHRTTIHILESRMLK